MKISLENLSVGTRGWTLLFLGLVRPSAPYSGGLEGVSSGRESRCHWLPKVRKGHWPHADVAAVVNSSVRPPFSPASPVLSTFLVLSPLSPSLSSRCNSVALCMLPLPASYSLVPRSLRFCNPPPPRCFLTPGHISYLKKKSIFLFLTFV